MLNGVLVVDKPVGLRSTDCLRQLSRVLGRGQRIGHAGTLDSTASGALIVLFGGASRLTEAVMNLPKAYDALVQFGWETDTDDGSGKTLGEPASIVVDDDVLRRAIVGQLGRRLQQPPAVSAVRVAGQRSHRLARQGWAPQPKARPVTITSITMTGAPAPDQRRLLVACHRGTYVRSLARDLGRVTGWKAHLTALHRLTVGDFRADDGLSPDDFDEPTIASRLRSPLDVALHYPHATVNTAVEQRLLNGLPQRFDFLPPLSFGVVTGLVALIGSRWLSLCHVERHDGLPMLRARANIRLGEVIS